MKYIKYPVMKMAPAVADESVHLQFVKETSSTVQSAYPPPPIEKTAPLPLVRVMSVNEHDVTLQVLPDVV